MVPTRQHPPYAGRIDAVRSGLIGQEMVDAPHTLLQVANNCRVKADAAPFVDTTTPALIYSSGEVLVLQRGREVDADALPKCWITTFDGCNP